MITSDFSPTAPENVAKSIPFADLDLGLLIHPIKKDIVPIKDIEAIKQSVRNLINTNFFDVPFDPSRGGNISSLLFDNIDAFTERQIADNIARVLAIYEPRIELNSVNVEADPERNTINIRLFYSITGLNNEYADTIELRRLR